MLLLAILFLAPAYYVLKARGYSPPIFLWPTILVTGALWLFQLFGEEWILRNAPALGIATGLPSILLLGLSYTLPKRKGAPGMSIEFPCPHCKQVIKFGRQFEGLARQCPKCEEIVSVPSQTTTAEKK